MTAKLSAAPPTSARPGPNPMPGANPFANRAVCDDEKIDDFVSVLGPLQAQTWLLAFRAELMAEFAGPDGASPNHGSHARIHHFCARAGLIGFEALHHACLGFLETRTGPGDLHEAYQQVRAAADAACPEIERRCARLT